MEDPGAAEGAAGQRGSSGSAHSRSSFAACPARMRGDDDVQLADDGGCPGAPDADQAGAFCLGQSMLDTRSTRLSRSWAHRAGIAPWARGRAPRAGWAPSHDRQQPAGPDHSSRTRAARVYQAARCLLWMFERRGCLAARGVLSACLRRLPGASPAGPSGLGSTIALARRGHPGRGIDGDGAGRTAGSRRDSAREAEAGMNEACDRCGPAVRAAYRVERRGELYLCRHCASQQWAALSAQGLDYLARRAAGGRAASEGNPQRGVTATGVPLRPGRHPTRAGRAACRNR
jgi:hypothetical protein